MNTVLRVKRDNGDTTVQPPVGPSPVMVGIYSLIAVVAMLIFAAACYVVCMRCFKKNQSDMMTQSMDVDISMQRRPRKKEQGRATDDMKAMQHDLQRQTLKKQNLDIEDIVRIQTGKKLKSQKGRKK